MSKGRDQSLKSSLLANPKSTIKFQIMYKDLKYNKGLKSPTFKTTYQEDVYGNTLAKS